jgi:hypothetical protein
MKLASILLTVTKNTEPIINVEKNDTSLNVDPTLALQNVENSQNISMNEDQLNDGIPFVCKKQSKNKSCHDWDNLLSNELGSYCTPGNRFHEILCASCQKLFVNKITGDKQFQPTRRTPMYCCPNAKDDCTYSLCKDCYKSAIPE